MACLGFIWHYFNVKLHIFFSVCLLLELQSASIHQFVQIPNTSVTKINSLINHDLALADYIKLLNCLFIKSILSNNHLPIFENFFKKAKKQTHSYSTRNATATSVFLPQPQTDQYGKLSMTYQTASK